MRISDWSSDVCSSDLLVALGHFGEVGERRLALRRPGVRVTQRMDIEAGLDGDILPLGVQRLVDGPLGHHEAVRVHLGDFIGERERGVVQLVQWHHLVHHPEAMRFVGVDVASRSEEHTSELPSLMRISYAVFSLKKNNTNTQSKT